MSTSLWRCVLSLISRRMGVSLRFPRSLSRPVEFSFSKTQLKLKERTTRTRTRTHSLPSLLMSPPKLLFELRRLRRLSSSSSSSSLVLCRSIHSHSSHSHFSPSTLLRNNSIQKQNPQFRFNPSLASPTFSTSRSFSISAPSSDSQTKSSSNDFDIEQNIRTESEKLSAFTTYDDDDDSSSQIADRVSDENQWLDFLEDEWYDPLIAATTSLLDKYHDFTGLPWWAAIISSTLALRMVLFPVLVLQLKKTKRFGELLPKLPPPMPPPNSGKSYMEQFMLFWKAKKALGCPSSLWFLASASVQAPCFLLWMVSIRRMSLDHHPGFDSGGILWFQNLCESPNAVLGPIFPLLIAATHYIGIQMSFPNSKARKETSVIGKLAKYYKYHLDFLTLPIFVIGFWVPQGSLVYWLTNNILNISQQVCLRHPAVREKLDLPNLNTLTINSKTVQNLPPDRLLSLSLKLLSDGHEDRAVALLRLALEKDPEFVRGLAVLGQTLMQQEKLEEATKYLERAISKLFGNGHPTNTEEVNLLILTSSWAGVMWIQQGNWQKGLEHLERIPRLKEPRDSKGKDHYYHGFFLLASALLNVERKDEAIRYLRKATAYNPVYDEHLQQCLQEESNVGAKS